MILESFFFERYHMTGRGRKSCFTFENKGMEGIDNLLENSRVCLAHDANTFIPGSYNQGKTNQLENSLK